MTKCFSLENLNDLNFLKSSKIKEKFKNIFFVKKINKQKAHFFQIIRHTLKKK
jgi:hypothetical protein